MLVTIPLCLSCHKQAIQGTVKKRVCLFCPLLMSMSSGLDSVDLSCDKCDGEELGAVLGERCRGLTPLSVVFTNRRGGCFYCRSHCTEDDSAF